MAEQIEHEGALPAPAEVVHLPGPSYLPVVVALGTTIALVGILQGWVIVALGLIITLVAVVKWIRQTREEMSELPLEH